MKKKKLSIFKELTLSSLVIILLILIMYTIINLISFISFTNDYEEDLLINRYTDISTLSRTLSENELYTYLNKTSTKDREYIRIYSDVDHYSTPTKLWNKIPHDYTELDTEVDLKLINFKTYNILTSPIIIDNNVYRIQIIGHTDIIYEFIENSFVILLIVIITTIILSITGSIYVSKIFLNRLSILTNTMNEIKKNGLNQRVEVSEFHDEFDKVNIVFNSMMDELESAFDEQRRFVADASHELKTPLTALKGHLNMLQRWGKNDTDRLEKSLVICSSEVDRLNTIVKNMLMLSKMEKLKIDLDTIQSINPKPIIEDILEYYKILTPKLNYKINIEKNILINMKEDHLKQLLIIFIDNSIKYNDKDIIEITISLKQHLEKTILSVRDNGIGISKDNISNVTKRFYKVDESRVNNNSFGLGLSIASRIIENYNGKLIISSELGLYTDIGFSI